MNPLIKYNINSYCNFTCDQTEALDGRIYTDFDLIHLQPYFAVYDNVLMYITWKLFFLSQISIA